MATQSSTNNSTAAGSLADSEGSTSNPKSNDCIQCKIVGAGGCFAASLYAVYQRQKAPSMKNRFVLSVIAFVAAGLGVARMLT